MLIITFNTFLLLKKKVLLTYIKCWLNYWSKFIDCFLQLRIAAYPVWYQYMHFYLHYSVFLYFLLFVSVLVYLQLLCVSSVDNVYKILNIQSCHLQWQHWLTPQKEHTLSKAYKKTCAHTSPQRNRVFAVCMKHLWDIGCTKNTQWTLNETAQTGRLIRVLHWPNIWFCKLCFDQSHILTVR